MDRVESVIDWMHRLYGIILGWALDASQDGAGDGAPDVRGSLFIVPLVGQEFVPEADQSFISLRLNTPVGSSLEFTNAKVLEVEQALKAIPEVQLAITTVGTDDGRNYARVNLRLSEPGERARTQKEIEKAVRELVRPIPGIELALGFDRPVWVNLLGPDPDTMTRLINEFAAKVAKVPGIADLEVSEKARNPGAVRPPQQRSGVRARHQRAAGRRHDPAAARR